MKLDSVRARLTLWNVAILALVLAGFGFGLCYSVRALLERSVDQELRTIARRNVERWVREGTPPGPPQGRGGMRGFPDPNPRPPGQEQGTSQGQPSPNPQPIQAQFGPSPEGLNRSQRLPPGWMDEPGRGQHDGNGTPTPGDEVEGPRQVYMRRPRFLNRSGGPFVQGGADLPWDSETVADAVSGREKFSNVTVDLEGTPEPLRVISYPMFRRDANSVWVEGVVQAAYPLAEIVRLEESLVRVLLMLIPLALLAAGAGGLFLTDRALGPVREITEAAAQLGAEDLSRRLRISGRDEFARLAATFNGMIARLQEAFGRLEAAYDQQRRFVGDASHELRTPLTTIKANTSLALCGDRKPEEYRELLQEVDQAADVMGRIVQDLLLLARSDAGQLVREQRAVAIGPILERAIASVRRDDSPPVELSLPAPSPMVFGDEHHLLRLFTNLLENAIRHTATDGQIRIAARNSGADVTIQVCDTGEGIPPEHLPHICDRFYRVDTARSRARGGTGLGLAICQSIIQAHHGQLRAESQVGVGTTMTVTLPRVEVLRADSPLPATSSAGRRV